jgi:hypothetical protein
MPWDFEKAAVRGGVVPVDRFAVTSNEGALNQISNHRNA